MPHRVSVRRCSATLLIAAALLATSACTEKKPAPDPTSTAASTRSAGPEADIATRSARSGSVTLDVGDQVLLDIGEYNGSVGDAWGVLESTDPGVVDTQTKNRYLGEKDSVGGPSQFGLLITGKRAGSTELTLKYCFRDRLSATCEQSLSGDKEVPDIKITVRVE